MASDDMVPLPSKMASKGPICRAGGSGIVLPIGGEAEQNLPDVLRAVLYGLALAYSFIGVSVVADSFMNSIETITAQVLYRKHGDRRRKAVKMWNETVANLTLMALGSSAPEILLSVVETLKNGNFSGALGPGTIVGSAAFNLLIIIGICISSIPDGEVRRINAVPAFIVTAIFSIIAYLWLVFIVEISSPNVIDISEGIVTILLLPILVAISYAFDKGIFPTSLSEKGDDHESSKTSGSCEEGLQMADAGQAKVDVCDASPLDRNSGVIQLENDLVEISCGLERVTCTVTVFRRNDKTGKISCNTAPGD